MPIRWDDLAGAVYHGPVGQSGDAVDNPLKVETGLTRVDQDLFYDPNDQELDDHISQSIADGFNPLDFIEALPEAFYNIASEALSTIAKIPQAELSKAPGTALEAMLRAGTDTGDLLMRIGSGVSMMGFKIAPGEAATQYHKLPESLKSVARGYWRTQRSIEQRRARQMMGDANYNFLPSQLVDQNLAEGLSMFLDPTTYFSFGASTGLKALAKTAAKRNVVSRGLINVAMKTGQMHDALINKAQSAATAPARLGLAAARETSSFIGEGIQQIKERFPKKTTGEPVQVDLPTEGKIGFIRKGIAGAVSYGEDAMELASEIKRQSARRNMPGVLDRIARDTSVRSGARNMASVLESMGANPVVRGLVVPGYKVGAAVSEGAAVGGMLGLLTFDEEFAANSLAGGALFGPVGKLAGGVIGYPEKNRQQVDNFIDDFKAKLEPEDLANFDEWTGGNRDDAKFFASLSYMFKNGHYKKGEGNLDIRFLNGEQYRAYGESQRERFGETAGVNFISSEGRNTVLINTDKKRTNKETLAHELGHAIMKLPEVQDAISTQDKLLFGDYNVTIKDGKEVLDYNFEGLLSKKWIDTFFDNYVNSLDESIRPQYRTLKDEQKFMIARDEIYADSMREFFGKFNPDSFIKAGKINTLKFKIGGSYQRNLYNGLGGSLARGIIGNVLMARNSMGLYAVRNIGRSLGLIKKDEPIVLRDGRVFSNIADMLQKRRENIVAVDDPIRDTIGTRWNLSELNSKDSREVASSFLPTAPVQRGEDGLPIKKNGRYQFQNKTQRKKADNERAAALTDAVDSTANSGETIKSLTPFQKLENGHYRGDFIPQATISALQGTSKRVVTPHNLDNIMRINDRMKDRPKDSGTLLEFTYNQVKEDGKKTPDIITSYRQMAPMVFDMSKNGKNFSITGIDLNDLMTRLERFEMSPSETERGKVFDIWRDEYQKLKGKPEDITLDKNPVRELFLQDLWLYLSGMSEGKSGIEALGGKGHTGEQLMSVTRKRDGLMRFLGFQKKDQLLTNENMFQQIVDKNSIIKSYRLDRIQNLSISDRKNMQITMGAHLAAQYNLAPGTLYSFKGSDENIPALNVRNEEGFPYADQIIDGQKTIETRNQPNLDKLIGKTVKIIRTLGPKSKDKAMVIGEVTIAGKKEYNTLAEFREDAGKHLVSEGSSFDFKKPKVGYLLENPKRYTQEYPADSNRGIVYSKSHSGPRDGVGKPAQDLPQGDVPGGDADTLPMIYDRDAKGNVKYQKDKPKILQQNYDFLDSPLVQSIIDQAGDSKQAAKDLSAIITSLNTSKLDARNKLTESQAELYDRIVDEYSEAFANDFARWKDDPDILSAIGWYSGVAQNISKLIPNDADRHIFLEFLGGTSPNTSVEQNFLYAIDLFNRWKSGGLKQYVDARDKTIKAFEDGSLIDEYIIETETPVWSRKGGKIEKDKQGNKVQKVDGDKPLFEYKWKSIKARNKFVRLYAEAESGNKSKNEFERSVKKARGIADKITPQDILSVSLYESGAIPVRKNGGKYGVHTDRIFQIVEGVWEAETDAPKAVNFTGNLKGTRTTATIDVWAARFLRRIGYESGGSPWRIQPSAETGVKNSDFYFGQDAFEAATKKIAEKYGDTFKMSADDLQAVMWFAEKRNWAQRGWSRVEDFGDFRDYLYKMQQESDGSLKLKDAVLRSTSEDFYNSLEFPAQDLQLPAATRKRRVEIADKILASRRKIERARAKVERTMSQVKAAEARVESSKTPAAKAKAKTTLKEKRKLADAAQQVLDQVNNDVRNMREMRMTLEEKPATYSR